MDWPQMLNLSVVFASEGMQLTCSVRCLVLGLSLDVPGCLDCLPHPGSGPGPCRRQRD